MSGADAETFVDRLRLHARERPDQHALEDAEHDVSWGALDRETDGIAGSLAAAGVGRGARVALMADPGIAGVRAMLGALKAGASIVPIPDLAGADAIARMLADSAPRAIFVCARTRHLIAQVHEADTPLIVSLDFEDAHCVPMQGLLNEERRPCPDVRILPGDEFNIIYSSGTTGRPKGIVHSHAVRAAWSRGVGPLAFPPGVRTLTTTPLCSNWTLCALVYTLWAGGCVRMMRKFSSEELLRECRTFRPDNIFLVPVQIARLLERADPAEALPGLPPTMKWSAGSYLPPDHKRALLERWPGGLIEIYGMTEGAPSALLLAHERPDKLHTVGCTDVEDGIKIIGEDGEELPLGAVGEVVGRAVDVMSGYHNDPAATEALIWRDRNGDPFFRSGDMGRLDDEGFLQILDRKKDVIISGGFNIYASDLETVLLDHPDVQHAAVFAKASDRWGETPAAAVVLASGADATGELLRDWANARLGRLQQISVVTIVDDLPRGALGKVLKQALRDDPALGDKS